MPKNFGGKFQALTVTSDGYIMPVQRSALADNPRLQSLLIITLPQLLFKYFLRTKHPLFRWIRGINTIWYLLNTRLNIQQDHISSQHVCSRQDKLEHVSSAGIHALDEDGCMEGTRVSLLKDLEQWSMDVTSPPIFWLDGMAGTGKSAIARSFCRSLRHSHRL